MLFVFYHCLNRYPGTAFKSRKHFQYTVFQSTKIINYRYKMKSPADFVLKMSWHTPLNRVAILLRDIIVAGNGYSLMIGEGNRGKMINFAVNFSTTS